MHLKIALWGVYLSQFADGKTGALRIFFKTYLLIYFWLHWASVASLRLSAVVEGGLLFTADHRLEACARAQ